MPGSVPINKPSLRFTMSRHNSLADVRAMIENLVEVSQGAAFDTFARTLPPPSPLADEAAS